MRCHSESPLVSNCTERQKHPEQEVRDSSPQWRRVLPRREVRPEDKALSRAASEHLSEVGRHYSPHNPLHFAAKSCGVASGTTVLYQTIDENAKIDPGHDDRRLRRVTPRQAKV